MSFTRKTHIVYILGFFLLVSIFVSAAAAQDLPGRTGQVKGHITALDVSHNTLSLNTDAFGGGPRDVPFWVEKTTKLANCGTGLHGNVTELKVGEKVIVSYYQVDNQLYAISVSPSGASLMRC